MSSESNPDELGPFYHGTAAKLAAGSKLSAGFPSNYRRELVMNHIYFTSKVEGAGLAAEVAAMLTGMPSAHVYLVEPEGEWEDDPNVTNKRFPGNVTRSYRSEQSLRIVREVEDFPRLSAEELDQWRDRLKSLTGQIIN